MLKGKNAVVTGSTSGIGLGIARAFAKDGANVVINGFGDAADIEKERTGIEKDFGVKALYSPADMTKPAEIAAMIKTAETTFGSVDVLVNNAGIQHVAPIEEFPIEKWDEIIAINLSSAFHAMRAAVPGMKARKWGRIIITASAHSLVASPFKAAYISAKHGLAGLTKTVALEVATFGITVNCISPGYVWTPLVAKQIPDTDEGAQHDRGAGQARRAARSPADQGVRHRRSGGGARALSHLGCGGRDHRRQPVDRRRLDRAVNCTVSFRVALRRSKSNSGPAQVERPQRQEAHQPRAAGRRRARRVHLGRARQLLEDGRLEIEGISGTSAGAVNAVMLADGLARGGPEEARKRLADFWRAASRDGDLSKLNRAISDRLFSLMPIAVLAVPAVDRRDVAHPFALRPQPAQHQSAARPDRALRRFRRGARRASMPLFIAATNVHTGRLRVFPRDKIDADAVMASAALPYVFRAVEIDGVPYWDGGYTANPPIYPFFRTTETEDVLVVQINPVVRATTPHSAQEIINRVNEITFNSSLVAEYPRHRVRRPADRPGHAAARHRAGRIPAHQRAPHRSRLHRQEADAGEPAQHRLRFLRDAAPRRPPRRAAFSRRAFRRHRRAQHHRSARGDAGREGRGDAGGPRPADEYARVIRGVRSRLRPESA